MSSIPTSLVVPLLTLLGVVVGAVLAGTFALVNSTVQHRRQRYEQDRTERRAVYVAAISQARALGYGADNATTTQDDIIAKLGLTAPKGVATLGFKLLAAAKTHHDEGSDTSRATFEQAITTFVTAARSDLGVSSGNKLPRSVRRAIGKS